MEGFVGHDHDDRGRMIRLRVVGYVIQPQVMADDGENLTPVQVSPVTVSSADWPNVVEMMSSALGELRQRVERNLETGT